MERTENGMSRIWNEQEMKGAEFRMRRKEQIWNQQKNFNVKE